MASVEVKRIDGSSAGTAELDDATFGIQPNVPVMHQVVTAQLAAARSGTQSTKTRAEVRGGGKKPWRQKGTGRARQGSTRAPHWAGGGVALGPKPRSYAQKTPKKMIQLALRSALSDRAADGKVVVIDEWSFDQPKTKTAKAALGALGLDGKVLVVVTRDDEIVYKSFRNLQEVQVILTGELNAYDVLCSDWVVFTQATLPAGQVVSDRAKQGGVQTSAPVSAEPVTEPAAAAPEPVAAEPEPAPAPAEPAADTTETEEAGE
ncbi:MAG: large subunit ribosomal protein [Acidimicrobiaceae bacterium]|jgi:large subunit ribosomal protein L4|nr:large subunit ribosomal protein [Acidimicrobiaceae bacterium]